MHQDILIQVEDYDEQRPLLQVPSTMERSESILDFSILRNNLLDPELKSIISENDQGVLSDDLQYKLIDTMKQNKFEEFQHLLEINDIPSNVSADKVMANVCWNNVGEQFVRSLLKSGIDPRVNIPNNVIEETFPETRKLLLRKKLQDFRRDRWCGKRTALHLAAGAANYGVLKALLEDSRTDVNVEDTFNNTALHYLASCRYGGLINLEGLKDCVTLLLSRQDINVNKSNKKQRTPLHQCATSGNFFVMCALLRDERVDVKAECNGENSVLHILAKFQHVTEENSELIAQCVDLSLRDGLLDINKCNNKNCTSLQLAATSGNYIVIRALLKDARTDLLVRDNDKYTALHRFCLNSFVDKKNVERCIEYFFCREELDVNARGASDRTPLHVAARSGNTAAFYALLKHKQTDVLAKDKIGRTVLHYLILQQEHNRPMEGTKECLDRLLKWATKDFSTSKSMKTVIDCKDDYGYTPLHIAVINEYEDLVYYLISRGASIVEKNSKGKFIIDEIDPKTLERCLDDNIFQISKPHDKEYKLVYDYKILVPEPNEKDFTYQVETQVLHYMSKNSHIRKLLCHPVITSFIYLKWCKMRHLLHFNIAYYLIFVLILNIYIILDTGICGDYTQWRKTQEESEKNDSEMIYAELTAKQKESHSLLWILLIPFTITLTLKQIIKLILSPWKYSYDIENSVEVLMLIFVCWIMFASWPQCPDCRHIFVMTIVFSWLQLVIVTGSLPMFSVKLEMLKTVLKTFLKYISWYSIMIIGFGISFYILFYNGLEIEENVFYNPMISVEKTILMMTGEYEYSTLNFSAVPVTSYIVFLLFVILISIVLLNLLNGLAVSDTQEIRRKAELLSVESRVKFLYNTENMLLDGRGLASHLIPGVTKFVKFLSSKIQVFAADDDINHCKAVVMPNKLLCRNFIEKVKRFFYRKSVQCTVKFKDKEYCVSEMTVDIIKSTKELLVLKKEKAEKYTKRKNMEEMWENMENQMKISQEVLINKIRYIENKINNFEKALNHILSICENKQ